MQQFTNVKYDFPVELQPLYTAGGKEAPRVRGIVRTDTKEAIATVGKRYKLIPHSDVVGVARNFITQFGQPEERFFTNKTGSVLVGEYTFRDRTFEVAKGDLVGLRLYVENNYGQKKTLKIKLGAIQLICLNGAVSSKPLYDMIFRHVESAKDIQFPEVEKVWNAFETQGKDWNKLARAQLNQQDYLSLAAQAVEQGVVNENALNEINGDTNLTAWGLYSRFTHHITHKESAKSTQLGKISRLARVDQFFEQTYA